MTTQNQEVTKDTINVPAQYARVKGANWFPLLYKRDIMILGQGGIGSWLSAMLSRVGCNLHLYDGDSYEEHNLTGQFATGKAIGVNKAVAMRNLISGFSPDCEVSSFPEVYGESGLLNDIVLCGFDSMASRKIAFAKWKEYVKSLPEEERKSCFFQDGRLLAEMMQILSIPGDRSDLIDKYEKEYLFDDSEVTAPTGTCTFKQTTHAAAMIASHMSGFFINWASNVGSGKTARQVPFYYEYIIPLNTVSCLNPPNQESSEERF